MKQHIQELEKRNNNERAEYIKRTLENNEIPFAIQKVKGMLASSENIIIDYPFLGNIPEGEKRILLGAHHNKHLKSPGANDNASGVAVLLEFLHTLKTESINDKNIRVVFFALEDGWGGWTTGSRHYVKEYGVKNLDKVYNIDSVGMGDRLIIFLPKRLLFPQNFIKPLLSASQKHNFPIGIVLHGGPSPLTIVDHMPFERTGFLKACTIGTVYQDDLDRFKLPVGIIKSLLYYLLRSDLLRNIKIISLPKMLQHYHNQADRSEFIEVGTLEKVLAIVWDAI